MKQIYAYILMLMAMVLAGCTSEGDTSGADGSCTPKLTMDTSADDEAATRAYWQDDTPAGGSPAVFHWEADTNEVHTALYSTSASKFITWTNDSTVTRCSVKLWSNTVKATVTSVNGVMESEYNNIKQDDKAYYLNRGTVTSQSSTGVSAKLELPCIFNQSAASNLMEFKDYTYAYAKSSVLAVSPTYISVNPARFTPAVACLRIIIDNTSNYNYKVRQITMKSVGQKVFAKNMTWTANASGATVTADAAAYDSLTNRANYIADKDTIEGIEIEAGTQQAYYMVLFPVSSWNGVSNLSFDITYSTGNSIVKAPTSLLAVSNIPNQKFEAGKIYNIRFKEMILDVDNVTVDDWKENDIEIGQITVKTPEVSVVPGNTVNVLLNAGHTDDTKITATPESGAPLTAAIRKATEGTVEEPVYRLYVDITASSTAEVGKTYTVTVNDTESNSMAEISVTIKAS